MNKKHLSVKMSQACNKMGFVIQKNKPEILMYSGIGGIVISAVIACKATLKIASITEDVKETSEKIHDAVENEEQEYTQDDANKDIALLYVKSGLKIVKLYAPAIMLGTLSIGALLKSHDILNKRNTALAAAYATVDQGFKDYRGRVVDRFGKEVDQELKYDIKTKTVSETTVDKKGNEKTVEKKVKIMGSDLTSDYAALFDESVNDYQKNFEYNRMFIEAQIRYANDLMMTRVSSKTKCGVVFLNEVYKMVGIEETKAGQLVGWVYNEERPIGDNRIEVEIIQCKIEEEDGSIVPKILLDFNVDGNVLDFMPTDK